MMAKEVGEVEEKAPWASLGNLGLHPEGRRKPWKHYTGE